MVFDLKPPVLLLLVLMLLFSDRIASIPVGENVHTATSGATSGPGAARDRRMRQAATPCDLPGRSDQPDEISHHPSRHLFEERTPDSGKEKVNKSKCQDWSRQAAPVSPADYQAVPVTVHVEVMVQELTELLPQFIGFLQSLQAPAGVQNGQLASNATVKPSISCGGSPSSCPASHKLSQYYLPDDTDGCSFSPDFFGSCCPQHDFCYETCGKAKADCDSTFNSCMVSFCQRYTDSVARDTCVSGAASYYSAVTLFGCTFFTKTQADYCDCEYCP